MQTNVQDDWYVINDIDSLPTPALVIYPDRVKNNIDKLLEMAGSVSKLRPHIKTCKSPEAISRMLEAGIYKFKCATIAEAELLGSLGVLDVLLAYQPVGPNIHRFITLIKEFPTTTFSCLVDSAAIAQQLDEQASRNNISINCYIDVNVGMNRTGTPVNKVLGLAADCNSLPHIKLIGLHCYDGHIHEASLDERKKRCDAYFPEIDQLIDQLNDHYADSFSIVAGGSPTFPIHVKKSNVTCSPGTFIFWDKGYGDLLAEQKFLPAALVITRVIAIIDDYKLCFDLGHKAIAAENELSKRVFFINAPQAKAIAHSEEHLVVAFPSKHTHAIGDIFYGIPYHICPTVALYDEAYAVIDKHQQNNWHITARKRKITI